MVKTMMKQKHLKSIDEQVFDQIDTKRINESYSPRGVRYIEKFKQSLDLKSVLVGDNKLIKVPI